MGILIDYFTAPDDAAAAEVINWVAGPDVHDKQAGVEPYPTAIVTIDRGTQVTWIAMMDSDPSGTTPESELGKVLVLEDEGERVVYRLSNAAHEALVRLAVDPEDPAALAQLETLGEPDNIIECVSELIKLATLAKERGWPLYVWLCV